MSYPYDYEAPPPSSSGSLRNFTPDFPEEDEYATEPPAPTYSSGHIGKSQQQYFSATGQRALPTAEAVAPPQQTAVRPLQKSTNHISGVDNRVWGLESGGGGGSHSDFMHKNNSAPYGVVDPYSDQGKAPGHSGFAPRDRSNTGSSGNDMNFDPQTQAGFSMVGPKFKLANQQLNQYRP